MFSIPRVIVTIALLLAGTSPVGAQALASQDVSAATTTSASAWLPTSEILQRPALLRVEQVALKSALSELHRTSGVPVAFSPSMLPNEKLVSCACQEETIGGALNLLLKDTGFRFFVIGGQILIEPDPIAPVAEPTPVRFASNVAPIEPARVRTTPAPKAAVRSYVGTVTGRVIDAATQRPIPSAQVHIARLRLGTLTGPNGQYALTNVPAGSHELRVELIGYRSTSQQVTVRDGQSTRADVQLTEQVLAMDAIVVTGTPGGTQRRAVGNVVEKVEATKIVAVTGSNDVQQLLGQRNAGVSVMPSSGQVGGVGGVIRVRGLSSLSLTNEPLVYIDGVRMNTNPRSGPNIRAGGQVNRMNDINPEDIESIEVIKGPAAATLYGTEASSGVIQIITKKGAQGASKFEVIVKNGTNWLQDPAGRLGLTYWKNPATGQIESFNLYEHEEQFGKGPVFQNGMMQSYAGSLRGGTDLLRYYMSTEYDDNEGIVSYNWQKKFNGRMNLGVLPHPKVDVNTSLGYVQGTTSLMQQYSGWDIWSNLLWGSPGQAANNNRLRGFLRATPEAIAEIEALAKIRRFTGSIQTSYRPTTWLATRLTTGLDAGDEINSIFFPRHPEGANWFFGAQSLGEKDYNRNSTTFVTLDYSATATVPLLRNLVGATSVGLQYYTKRIETSRSFGKLFPSPAVGTVGGAAVTSAEEDLTENKTVGVFIQQQLEWRNRVFVTGALRGDDNSAFGATYEAAIYPKFSATWVVHEEPFFNIEPVSSLRLRTAWGAAGKQPDVFAAVRLYDPSTGPSDGSVLTPGAIGNPDLKPERGEELELGFDAGFLGERINLAFTYYTRTTSDAIVSRALPPSLGFPGSQFVNLGKIKNWGTEVGLTSQILTGPRLGWDLGLTFATMKNEVMSLGGLPPITLGNQQHREGYPIAGFFWWKVVSAEFDARGQVTNEMCDDGNGGTVRCYTGTNITAPRVYWGQPTPTWEFGVNSTFTLPFNLKLYGRVDARGGNLARNNDLTSSHTSYQNTLFSNEQTDPVFMAYRKIGRDPLALYDASFAKLREVSASYTLPSRFTQIFRASGGTFTLAGRNLVTLWQKQKLIEINGKVIPDPQVWDSEMRGVSELSIDFQSVIPPLAQVVATLRFSF
jgi:TonB-linked SusC/RagA family outer membrane protein